MDADDNINIHSLIENNNIIKFEVQSQVEYAPNTSRCPGIKRYCCECANGNRTVGCCSHVAAIIYYISHARYLSRIVRPAEILSNIFNQVEVAPVINEDSDED